jgi:hypothetical protein
VELPHRVQSRTGHKAQAGGPRDRALRNPVASSPADANVTRKVARRPSMCDWIAPTVALSAELRPSAMG